MSCDIESLKSQRLSLRYYKIFHRNIVTRKNSMVMRSQIQGTFLEYLTYIKVSNSHVDFIANSYYGDISIYPSPIMESFPYSHMTINYGPRIILIQNMSLCFFQNNTILPTVHKQPIFIKPQNVLDNLFNNFSHMEF